MLAELKSGLHKIASVKRSAIPEVYSDQMRSECKGYVVYSFIGAGPSSIVLRCR